jgi:deoxyribonuclease V
MAFRVMPAILSAWKKLNRQPEVLMVPGHGIAHPRSFGLASHLGLWLEISTIGVAKRVLYGLPGEIGLSAGEWSELADEHDPSHILGAAARTREGSPPVIVSPGHLIDLPHAIQVTLLSVRRFRLPEPLRLAHSAAVQSIC